MGQAPCDNFKDDSKDCHLIVDKNLKTDDIIKYKLNKCTKSFKSMNKLCNNSYYYQPNPQACKVDDRDKVSFCYANKEKCLDENPFWSNYMLKNCPMTCHKIPDYENKLSDLVDKNIRKEEKVVADKKQIKDYDDKMIDKIRNDDFKIEDNADQTAKDIANIRSQFNKDSNLFTGCNILVDPNCQDKETFGNTNQKIDNFIVLVIILILIYYLFFRKN